MNGIEKITGRILDDARAQAETVVAAARQQADELALRLEQQADQLQRQLEQRGEEKARQQEQRLVSAAQSEGCRRLLAARQDMVEQVYALALEQLCSMPREEYIRVLVQLLQKASSSGKEQAVFSEKDREAGLAAVEEVNRITGKCLTVAPQPGEMAGGFLLVDRNTQVNCTFETLVRLQKGETASAVANMLFA